MVSDSVMRHPSLIERAPDPRLTGRRVHAAPARAAGLRGVARRPPSQRGLAAAVGAAASRQAWPTRRCDRSAFDARCAARDRERAAGHAYPFGVFVDDQLAGEVNLNNVDARRDAGRRRSATGSTAIAPVRATSPRRRRADALRVRAAAIAPARDLHRPAQRQQPAGRREARRSAAKASPSASSRSTASGRTTSGSGSPSRSGGRAQTT